ncbi:hypothetical protein SAMN06298223_0372 [Olsenella sp. KH1P3]|uniref:Secreted protein n=1 Tax=Parafannyhessea umbonata TaxID=604330 RepID=A0A1H6JA14_9ACTN|nr:hypothetical protein SAMN05216447_105123 [Parafannyhessea umbonata]SJZ44462.1 hypothetical protein SAMN06298223_0372 [Olsenella sp. KH1P3]
MVVSFGIWMLCFVILIIQRMLPNSLSKPTPFERRKATCHLKQRPLYALMKETQSVFPVYRYKSDLTYSFTKLTVHIATIVFYSPSDDAEMQ